MPEREELASPSKSRSCLALVLAPILLLGIGLGVKYYIGYKRNQKVERRRNLPPHVVTYEYLTRIPEGEPYVDRESVIVDGYLVTPNNLPDSSVGSTNIVFSSYPLDKEPQTNLPQASVVWCNESRKVNCFDVTTYSPPPIPGAAPEGQNPFKYFSDFHVVIDSGEKIMAGERVRFHGQLSIREESHGGISRTVSILGVAKIEKPN
jgi:hypothetical protein